MKWITSYGGPFICIARRSADSWEGIEGLSLPIDEEAFRGFDRSRLGPFGHTDYGWACLCDDYASLLPGRVDEAIIVGDLPYPLLWHPLGETAGLLVKWAGADSDEQVAAHLPEAVRAECDAPVAVFDVTGELIVFDAACMLAETGDNHLCLHLKPGRYAVSPARYVATDIELHLLKLELVA